MAVTQSDATPGYIDDHHGPIEREVRRSVIEMGELTGIRPALAEICYALARDLDAGTLASSAPVARELALRLAELESGGTARVSRADELAARRAAHIAATSGAPEAG